MISSFLGYLYLVFGDLFIDGELRKKSEIIKAHKIFRYVDDIYILIKFKDEILVSEQKDFIDSFGARIADLLFYRLGLRLNPKTRFYWLSNKKQLEDLLASLKKIYPQYYVSDDADDETLDNKVNAVLEELRNLKKSDLEPDTFSYDLQGEILKEIYDKRVLHLLDTQKNLARIRQVFKNFDFNRVAEYPAPIIIIILKEQKTARLFREYLLKERQLTTKDVDLILTYLCQINFQDVDVINVLEQYAPMEKIISKVKVPSLSTEFPGYYILRQSQVQKLAAMPSVIEQIRQRVHNERLNSYSVALNHLLNELHAICIQIDTNANHREYDVNNVMKFLDKKGLTPETNIGIRNLFDRRNTNQVSHPGSDYFIAWSVTKAEYDKHRNKVSECLNALL